MKHLLTSLWRWTRRLVLALALVGVIGAAVAAVLYKQHVVDDPGEHISRDAIMAIIAQESPVLYSDGQHRIGVFFAQEHRDYVPYDQIPKAWVDAITSSEDKRFFEHHGVDFKGVVRAMRDNLLAGHIVAGGSTDPADGKELVLPAGPVDSQQVGRASQRVALGSPLLQAGHLGILRQPVPRQRQWARAGHRCPLLLRQGCVRARHAGVRLPRGHGQGARYLQSLSGPQPAAPGRGACAGPGADPPRPRPHAGERQAHPCPARGAGAARDPLRPRHLPI
ncbi:MAG: hypothetical protein GXP62_03660 [Oligoflexia bacterium]|nr:hypothetical protein [Oligoflexia bacterium]